MLQASLPGLVFAAPDANSIIGIAFLVITVLGWIVRIIKANVPQGPAAKNNAWKQLEEFLKSVQEDSEQSRAEAANRPPPRPPKRDRQNKQRGKGNRNRETPTPVEIIEEGVGPTRVGSTPLGGELRQHVSAYMTAGNIQQQAERFVGHEVDEHVSKHLGTPGTVAGGKPNQPPKALAGLAQAVLWNEILQPPVSRRRK